MPDSTDVGNTSIQIEPTSNEAIQSQHHHQPPSFVQGQPISPATLAAMMANHQLQTPKIELEATNNQMDTSTDIPIDKQFHSPTSIAVTSPTQIKRESPRPTKDDLAHLTNAQPQFASEPHSAAIAAAISMQADTNMTDVTVKLENELHLQQPPPPAPNVPMLSVSQQQPPAAAPQIVAHDSDDDSDEEEGHKQAGSAMTDTPSTAAAAAKAKKNARVSCHQCKTTKDDGLLLFCTTKAEKGRRKRKCRKKYCDACLRRSYNMSISALTPQEIATYCCPACNGSCSCAACQRKQIESLVRKEATARTAGPTAATAPFLAARQQHYISYAGYMQQGANSAVPTAATEVAAAVAVPGVPVGSAPLTAQGMQAQLQAQMQAQIAAAAARGNGQPYYLAAQPASVAQAVPGAAPVSMQEPVSVTMPVVTAAVASAHVLASAQPQATQASLQGAPQHQVVSQQQQQQVHPPHPQQQQGLLSPSSQPASSPSGSSIISTTAGLTQSLAQLATNSPVSSAGSVSGGQTENTHAGVKQESSITATAQVVPLTPQSTGTGLYQQSSPSPSGTMATSTTSPTSPPLTLAQQQAAAAAAAATTQAEIEEKTRQLQDLLARRMSQDPNFLANLGPGNPLAIIRNIVQATARGTSVHSAGGGGGGGEVHPLDEDHDMVGGGGGGSHSSRHHPLHHDQQLQDHWEDQSNLSIHQAQALARRVKYEKQMQHLPPDAPIHAALSMPTKSRSLSAQQRRMAAAGQMTGDMSLPSKSRTLSQGAKPIRAPKTANPNGQPRIYKRKGTPGSPYQRLQGAEGLAERERRMSPAHGIYDNSHSAPSSSRSSPALKGRPRAPSASHMTDLPLLNPYDHPMHHDQSHHDRDYDDEDEDMFDESTMRATMMHDQRPLQSVQTSRGIMTPNDPNYHLWIQQKRHQQHHSNGSANSAAEEAQLQQSNSYNQRLLQAHKLLMEQSKQVRAQQQQHHQQQQRFKQEYGDHYSDFTPQGNSSSSGSSNTTGSSQLLPPAVDIPRSDRYSQPYPGSPPHQMGGSNGNGGGAQRMSGMLFSPAGGYGSPTERQMPGSNSIFSPVGGGSSSHPQQSGGLFSPPNNNSNGQSLFSPPDGAPQLSIGVNHPSHAYVMGSPDPNSNYSMQSTNTMFQLSTPMDPGRGISAIVGLNQQPGSASPVVTNSSSFLFTPLAPQTPSIFMSQTLAGSSTSNMDATSTVPSSAQYPTQFDWSQVQTGSMMKSTTTTTITSSSTPLRLNLPIGSPNALSSYGSLSPHIHGSNILGMLNGSPMHSHSLAMPMSPAPDGLPLLPTA